MFRENILEGQAGIVTGGSSGIGLAIARYLVEHGSKITITGRDQEKLEQAQADLGGDVTIAAGDVRKSEEVQTCLQTHLNAYGRVDFLINNAAGNFLCPLEKMSENAFKSVIDIVATGTFLWSKAVLPQMKDAKYGRIVNIGTTYSWGHGANVGHSGVAKAGVLNLTKTMAVEWGPFGITANLIAPGPIEGTEGVKRLMPHPNAKSLINSLIPSGRLGQGSEIAAAVVFLISPLGSYINGAAIPIDGGLHLAVPGLLPVGMPIGEGS